MACWLHDLKFWTGVLTAFAELAPDTWADLLADVLLFEGLDILLLAFAPGATLGFLTLGMSGDSGIRADKW